MVLNYSIYWHTDIFNGSVKGLSNVLRDIDDVLPQRDLSDQLKEKLEEIVRCCRDVLKELEDVLDRYQELDHNVSGLGKRSRRVWKRFRWDQGAIDGLRSRITLNISLFNTFLEQISRLVSCSDLRILAKRRKSNSSRNEEGRGSIG